MFTIQQSKTFAPEKKNCMFLWRIIITACISQSQKKGFYLTYMKTRTTKTKELTTIRCCRDSGKWKLADSLLLPCMIVGLCKCIYKGNACKIGLIILEKLFQLECFAILFCTYTVITQNMIIL